MEPEPSGPSAWQQRLWSVYSKAYDGLLDLVPYRRLLDLVTKHLDVRPGQEVLDLGCGTANLLVQLRSQAPGAVLVGVDSSPEMLAIARRKLGSDPLHRLVEADLLDHIESLEPHSVDRVVSVNVLYTMHAADRARFWAGALRVVRPGGRLVVVTTDRAGVGPVMREQIDEVGLLRCITPRIAVVTALNMVIWAMEVRQVFDPAPLETLVEEVEAAGGGVAATERCYGGEESGVDVLLSVEPVVDLTTRARPAVERIDLRAGSGQADGEVQLGPDLGLDALEDPVEDVRPDPDRGAEHVLEGGEDGNRL